MLSKRSKFKDQWNVFQLECYHLLKKQFNDNDEALEQFQNELDAIKSNEERIKYVLQHKSLSNALEEHVNNLFNACERCNCETKCIQSSEEHKNEIDDISIQMSVLLSNGWQTNGENISQLAKRRAKSYYLLNRFEECVDEINELQISDTNFLRIKSECMAKLCECEKIRSDQIEIEVKNEKLNGASDCITISIDETKGRLIKSVTNIKKGTILIDENSYAHWLRPTLYHLYCYACLKKLNYRYFVCGQCLKIKFCSLKCLKKAWETYHRHECDYIDTLKHMAMGHFALRMVSIAGVDTVIETARKESNELPLGEFKNEYKYIYSLVGDEYLRDSTLFLASCVSGAVLALCAEKMCWISRDSSDYYLFAGVLFKHMMQVLINTFVIYDCSLTKRDLQYIDLSIFNRKRKKVGVGLYATSSLLSHSCDNNCIKLYSDSTIVVIPLRNINEGEEVTINYGVNCHVTTNFNERKEFLLGNFGFNCKCNVCETPAAISV